MGLGIPPHEAAQWERLREVFSQRMRELSMSQKDLSRACGFHANSSVYQFLNGKDVIGKERLIRAARQMGGINLAWLDSFIPYHVTVQRRPQYSSPPVTLGAAVIAPPPAPVTPQQVPLPTPPVFPYHTTDAERFAALRKGLEGLTREDRQRWITIMELFLDAK